MKQHVIPVPVPHIVRLINSIAEHGEKETNRQRKSSSRHTGHNRVRAGMEARKNGQADISCPVREKEKMGKAGNAGNIGILGTRKYRKNDNRTDCVRYGKTGEENAKADIPVSGSKKIVDGRGIWEWSVLDIY